MHAAVSHMLQHPPAQGKYALDRLMRDVESEYFPTRPEQAVIAFSSGPLRKPRASLVRNFVITLAKRLIKENSQGKPRLRVAASLRAVATLHPIQYNEALSQTLSKMLRAIDDAHLSNATDMLVRMDSSWQHVEPDMQQRLRRYVEQLPEERMGSIHSLLAYAPLAAAAESRVGMASGTELMKAVNPWDSLHPKLADRLVDLYLRSGSFDEANELANRMSMCASDLSADHVRKVLVGAQENDQILYSFRLGPLIGELRSHRKITEIEFDQLLHANGLSKYAHPPQHQG